VAESLETLAFALSGQHKIEGVEELLREALELRIELLGSHPATAESLSNLGTFLYAHVRQSEAIPLFRQSLDMKREVYGAVHPEIALGMNNLAYALHDTGDLDGAEKLFRSAVEQQRTLLGDAHPDLGQSLNNLAFVLHDRGDYEGARDCFFEAVTVYRRSLEDGHDSVLRAIANATGLVSAAINLRERDFGAEHQETVRARLDMAELDLIAGRPDEARPLAEEIWQRLTESSDAEGALLARATSVLGAVLADQGDLVSAEELLDAGFKTLLVSVGRDARETRVAGERLASMYERTNRPEKATEVRKLLPTTGSGK
jgi:tetratricopeptide (TPR) repeat protein